MVKLVKSWGVQVEVGVSYTNQFIISRSFVCQFTSKILVELTISALNFQQNRLNFVAFMWRKTTVELSVIKPHGHRDIIIFEFSYWIT